MAKWKDVYKRQVCTSSMESRASSPRPNAFLFCTIYSFLFYDLLFTMFALSLIHICIPAIQPISNKDLRKTASGYGTRIDPIYGTTRFHAGMDFSAHPGTRCV